MLRRAPAVVVMLLASSLPVSAQTLARPRPGSGNAEGVRSPAPRRASPTTTPSATSGSGLLRRRAHSLPTRLRPIPTGLRPGAPASDRPPAASGPLLGGEAPRQDVYGRHLTSAEAYLRQCEERLRTAWLTAGEASPAGNAAQQARRIVENAAAALGRAKAYRDRAEVAAQVAGALPAGRP